MDTPQLDQKLVERLNAILHDICAYSAGFKGEAIPFIRGDSNDENYCAHLLYGKASDGVDPDTVLIGKRWVEVALSPDTPDVRVGFFFSNEEEGIVAVVTPEKDDEGMAQSIAALVYPYLEYGVNPEVAMGQAMQTHKTSGLLQ